VKESMNLFLINIGQFDVQKGECLWVGYLELWIDKEDKEVRERLQKDSWSRLSDCVKKCKEGRWYTFIRCEERNGRGMHSFVCRHESVDVPKEVSHRCDSNPTCREPYPLYGIFPDSSFGDNDHAFFKRVKKRCKKRGFTTMGNTCFAIESDFVPDKIIWETEFGKVVGIEIDFGGAWNQDENAHDHYNDFETTEWINGTETKVISCDDCCCGYSSDEGSDGSESDE
jgi:hypothetical protein